MLNSNFLLKVAQFLVPVLLILPVLSVQAQEPQIPKYWDDRERIEKPDLSRFSRIRFLTTIDFPPFSFLDEGGNLTGFHVELARAICAELDILQRCQIQALPWAELEGALQRDLGEAIIAGLAVTGENRRRYTFTRTYLEFPARLVVRRDEAVTGKALAAKSGTRIGVLAGTAHEAMARDFFPEAEIVTYPDDEALRAGLKDKSVEAVLADAMGYSFWLLSRDAGDCCRFADGAYFSRAHLGQGLAIAVEREDSELAAAFDYALAQLQRNGVFAELYLRSFPLSFY